MLRYSSFTNINIIPWNNARCIIIVVDITHIIISTIKWPIAMCNIRATWISSQLIKLLATLYYIREHRKLNASRNNIIMMIIVAIIIINSQFIDSLCCSDISINVIVWINIIDIRAINISMHSRLTTVKWLIRIYSVSVIANTKF